jgi:sigma-B regulation protein RsbU (phosphoserine phosphatase)
MAGVVQRRMIPQAPREVPGYDIAAIYIPTQQLSGDFYDFIRLPEENLGVAICDVVGKGVRASLLMASIRASLRGHAMNVYEMSLVLDKVNRDLCADTTVSDFASLFYGVLDLHDSKLTYANAGHCPPMLFRGGTVRELESSGMLLGVDPDAHYRYEWINTEPGDVILMYTDGLAEALNFDEEAFGTARIQAAAWEAIEQDWSADRTARHVVWTMRRFAGLQTRFDDITMLVIKVA